MQRALQHDVNDVPEDDQLVARELFVDANIGSRFVRVSENVLHNVEGTSTRTGQRAKVAIERSHSASTLNGNVKASTGVEIEGDLRAQVLNRLHQLEEISRDYNEAKQEHRAMVLQRNSAQVEFKVLESEVRQSDLEKRELVEKYSLVAERFQHATVLSQREKRDKILELEVQAMNARRIGKEWQRKARTAESALTTACDTLGKQQAQLTAMDDELRQRQGARRVVHESLEREADVACARRRLFQHSASEMGSLMVSADEHQRCVKQEHVVLTATLDSAATMLERDVEHCAHTVERDIMWFERERDEEKQQLDVCVSEQREGANLERQRLVLLGGEELTLRHTEAATVDVQNESSALAESLAMASSTLTALKDDYSFEVSRKTLAQGDFVLAERRVRRSEGRHAMTEAAALSQRLRSSQPKLYAAQQGIINLLKQSAKDAEHMDLGRKVAIQVVGLHTEHVDLSRRTLAELRSKVHSHLERWKWFCAQIWQVEAVAKLRDDHVRSQRRSQEASIESCKRVQTSLWQRQEQCLSDTERALRRTLNAEESKTQLFQEMAGARSRVDLATANFEQLALSLAVSFQNFSHDLVLGVLRDRRDKSFEVPGPCLDAFCEEMDHCVVVARGRSVAEKKKRWQGQEHEAERRDEAELVARRCEAAEAHFDNELEILREEEGTDCSEFLESAALSDHIWNQVEISEQQVASALQQAEDTRGELEKFNASEKVAMQEARRSARQVMLERVDAVSVEIGALRQDSSRTSTRLHETMETHHQELDEESSAARRIFEQQSADEIHTLQKDVATVDRAETAMVSEQEVQELSLEATLSKLGRTRGECERVRVDLSEQFEHGSRCAAEYGKKLRETEQKLVETAESRRAQRHETHVLQETALKAHTIFEERLRKEQLQSVSEVEAAYARAFEEISPQVLQCSEEAWAQSSRWVFSAENLMDRASLVLGRSPHIDTERQREWRTEVQRHIYICARLHVHVRND